jgi:uncharacterized protein
MKNIIVSMTLFLIMTGFVSAQQFEEKQRQITVLGSVVLNEIADQASLSFRIKGVGVNLRQAVEDAMTKTKDLTDKLILLGINKNNISTADFTSGENYGDKAFLSSSRDYQAVIVTFIKTDSLSLLQPVLFLLSESKVESISTISFSRKDELELRRNTRIAAGLKAKEKALDISNALGVKIGKVLFIEEIQSTQTMSNNNAYPQYRGSLNYPNPFNPSSYAPSTIKNEFNPDEVKGSGLFAQTVSVTSQVKVTFALE